MQRLVDGVVQSILLKNEHPNGKVVESSLIRKGKKDSYNYTHEVVLVKNNQTLHKKRNISANEYLQLLEHKSDDYKTL